MAATGRRRPVRPLTQARGRLAMAADPDNTGVLNYIWVPSASSLPGIRAAPAIIRLDEQVRERLLDPLRAPPVTDDRSRRGRRMLAERHGTTPRDVPRIAPTRRRLQRRARDPFDLASWRRAHRELDQRRDQHADLLADAGRAAAVRDANVGIERAGVRLPALPTTLRQAGDVADRITFWTGSGALVLARFRDVFGGVFVRVADAYERMRERLRRRLRDQNGPGGGGLPGAAIRVMFTLIKSAARVVVERTVDVLKQSLAAGIGRKLTELVGGDRIAELEERVAQVQAMREEMEQQATDTVDQLVERVIGPYDELLAGFQQISDLIQQVNRVATIVRWGARAIACVSPPAIGCLWALAQGVIEELAAVVVGTCWFQEKVKPLVLELDVVRQLPTRLARLILDAMREVVPAGLRDVFGEVDVPTLDPDEVECDPSGSGHGLSESQRALLELQEELGEERFRAWLELEHAAGVPGSRPFTVASARALADVIRDSGASASDLRRWARAAEGQLVTIPMPVGEFLAEMGGRDLAEEAVVGDPGPVPGQGSGSGSAEGGGGRVATARGEPTDRDIGEDAVGITWHPRVISGVTPAHTKHARVELHAWLWGEVGGREIGVLVDPVHARVTRRFHRRREGHRVRTIELTVPRQTFELEHELYGIERVYVGPGSFLHEFRPDTPTTSGRQP